MNVIKKKQIKESFAEECDFNEVLESVIVEDTINNISMMSEGAIAKVGLKVLLKKERQEKMISGKPVNSNTGVKYNVRDVSQEIKAVEWYLKYGKNNLTDDQEANLKKYLPKLKKRYKELGGIAAENKYDIDSFNKAAKNYVVYKTLHK